MENVMHLNNIFISTSEIFLHFLQLISISTFPVVNNTNQESFMIVHILSGLQLFPAVFIHIPTNEMDMKKN